MVTWLPFAKCGTLGIGGGTQRFVTLSVVKEREMKHFLEILADVRVAVAEVGGTLTLIFLIVYGTYKAWKEFVVKLFK